MEALLAAIEDKTARVVMVGLGYVGLPVACLLAEAGFSVTGLDVDQRKVDLVNQGRCPIEGREPGLAELVARATAAGRLRATVDYGVCRDAQVILIAVETPVDEATRKPAYRALRAALADLGRHLARGALVIVESTLAPGTMAGVVQPALEEASGLQGGRDFFLVHCPERLMPGRLLANIRGCPRVVGGMTPEAAQLAAAFYRSIVQADLDLTDGLTAELVKTMENAYRDVQIAFANEMALLCEALGADVWRVRELVNKSPGRSMHLPGAGVGGHCIPKDGWLLIANAPPEYEPRLIPLARAINDGMPAHMVHLTIEALRDAGVSPQGARVAVLGYAYLENSDDTRNSPSEALVARLREGGAEIVIHDPYVAEHRGNLEGRIAGCDALVLMVAHDEYRALDLKALAGRMRRPVLVDGRHVFEAEEARAAGWVYRGVGVGR